MERIEEWVAKMGGGERSRKFLSFGEQDVEISCSGDGKIGTYAADTGVTGGRLGSQKAAVFTGSQMQEFEKQNLICKYMMASIPVPPQLLVPFPRTQSNKHGSDPELWRCRRTDGKKWRCSKDVLPDQKYCERHAHKNRHRSRKHVEILSQKNYPVPNFQFSAAASCDQARGGSIGQNKQKQQLILSPPSTLGFTIGNAKNINTSLYRLEVNNGEKGFLSSNPYVHRNFGFPQGSWNANAQNFFGAQSAREEDGLHNAHGCFSCKSCLFSNQKVPFSSLSMPIGSGSGEDSQNHGLNKNNPESWSSSPMPGGPLGEALCLGTASNLPSPHGHSNSSGTSSGSFL